MKKYEQKMKMIMKTKMKMRMKIRMRMNTLKKKKIVKEELKEIKNLNWIKVSLNEF